MDNLQFYNFPPEKAPSAKRRGLFQPLPFETENLRKQEAGVEGIALQSQREKEDALPYSQAETQTSSVTPKEIGMKQTEKAANLNAVDVTLQYSNSSDTFLLQQTSEISNLTSEKSTACDSSSNSQSAGRQLLGLEFLNENGVVPMRSTSCEEISSSAVEEYNTSSQDNLQGKHMAKEVAHSLETNNTIPPMTSSEVLLPCDMPAANQPSNCLSTASCEECTFKNGQIFALVQILRMSHHVHLQGQGGEKASRSRNSNAIASRVNGSKSPPRAPRSRRTVRKKKEKEKALTATITFPVEVQPNVQTRSGRISKATQKILHSGVHVSRVVTS